MMRTSEAEASNFKHKRTKRGKAAEETQDQRIAPGTEIVMVGEKCGDGTDEQRANDVDGEGAPGKVVAKGTPTEDGNTMPRTSAQRPSETSQYCLEQQGQ